MIVAVTMGVSGIFGYTITPFAPDLAALREGVSAREMGDSASTGSGAGAAMSARVRSSLEYFQTFSQLVPWSLRSELTVRAGKAEPGTHRRPIQ